LEDFDTVVEINGALEMIREHIKISVKESLGLCELKKHKVWLDKGCLELLDQRKQVKLQWLQHTSEINGDNLNNIRCETSRHFRNKKKEYLKDNISEPATNSRNKNIRDLYRRINEFERSYDPRSNSMKDACRYPEHFKHVEELLY
jgi:hypothetical protein